MATPKKKHLIELMIEAGVKWPDGAEYAAQDKRDMYVWFYTAMPKREGVDKWTGDTMPIGSCDLVGGKLLPSLCRSWHQTIVTREQYAEAVAAVTPDVRHEVRESEDIPVVDAVEWHNPPSIEQLTTDYHAKAAEAVRLQAVADDALKAADDALLALEKAGELIGLVISIDTKPKQVEQPIEPVQPEITGWRDLRVGDIIECVAYGDSRDGEPGSLYGYPGGWAQSVADDEHTVGAVNSEDGQITLSDVRDSGYAFRFIRRP